MGQPVSMALTYKHFGPILVDGQRALNEPVALLRPRLSSDLRLPTRRNRLNSTCQFPPIADLRSGDEVSDENLKVFSPVL